MVEIVDPISKTGSNASETSVVLGSVLSSIDFKDSENGCLMLVSGDWTIESIETIERKIRKTKPPTTVSAIDVSALGRLDTAGAYLILSHADLLCSAHEHELRMVGDHPHAGTLFRLVGDAEEFDEHPVHRGFSIVDLFAKIGEGGVDFLKEGVETLSFIGHSAAQTIELLFKPHRIRWTSVFAVMEEAGLNALPSIGFLSFFVGMVIAFIGATILEQTVGATVFTIDLVGWAMLREFGVVLTGILLAGRTNSSFTAQIGSMKMRQEVDAMRTLGLDPYEVLVVPRVLAMLIMTPFLAFGATMAGLFGGLVVSWFALDISPILFITRLQETIPVVNFWVGMSKTPVFALIVALIACRQGLLVEGDVQSLGRATTASVVHAIFLIIVADAMFAMIFLELGI